MSIIPNLGNNLEHLPDILDEYNQILKTSEPHLKIKGKTIGEANKEQAGWLSYYDQRRIELYSITKFLETKVNTIRSIQYKKYTENYSIDLTERSKDKYIDSEPVYLAMMEIYLECKETHDKFASLVEAFKARGYALNNLTKLYTTSMEDTIL